MSTKVTTWLIAVVLTGLVMGRAVLEQAMLEKEDAFAARISEDVCETATAKASCLLDARWDYDHWYVLPLVVSLAVLIGARLWTRLLTRRP